MYHREADGGQISWQNESRRRHGSLKKPDEQWSFRDLVTHPKEGNTKIGAKDKSNLPGSEEGSAQAKQLQK